MPTSNFETFYHTRCIKMITALNFLVLLVRNVQFLARADCQNVRARGTGGAEPERACMMWYRAVAHVSLYFSCPPSLAPRRLPVAVAAHPSLRPSARPSEVLSPFWRHHASFALPPTSVRPCARPSVRGTTGRPRWKWWRRAGAPTLATSSVRLHVVWLRRHHFVFSVVHRCRRCAIAQGAPPRSRPNMCGTIILMTQSSLVASKKNWARHGTVTRPPKFSRSASTRVPKSVPVWPGTAWNVPIVV